MFHIINYLFWSTKSVELVYYFIYSPRQFFPSNVARLNQNVGHPCSRVWFFKGNKLSGPRRCPPGPSARRGRASRAKSLLLIILKIIPDFSFIRHYTIFFQKVLRQRCGFRICYWSFFYLIAKWHNLLRNSIPF